MYAMWSSAAKLPVKGPLDDGRRNAELRRRLRFHLLTLQSIRKSGVKWAARCLASHSDIRGTCRHKQTSENFYKYIEEGCAERNDAIGSGQEDPVFFLWRFKPAGIANIDSRIEASIDSFINSQSA